MYTRRGYVIVAESARTQAIIETASATHKACGVRSTRLGAGQVASVLPAADQRRIRAAIYLPDGGTAPHHAAMKGALAACRERGVEIHYHTPVTAIECHAGRAVSVESEAGRFAADLIVVAAGAQSSDVAAMAGVDLAAQAFRIEAMASEPVRPLIGPAVALMDRLSYVHQSARGEIVGGTEIAGESAKRGLASTEYVMPRYARHMVEIFPQVAHLRILRQWAGMIHPAPDGGPLLGPHPDIEGLWFSAGWTYGIAGAPGAADLLSRAMLSGEFDERMLPFAIDRFRRGKPVPEASAVIDNASGAASPEPNRASSARGVATSPGCKPHSG